MNSSWKSAAKISLIYIAVGAIWILASDNALTYFFSSEETINQLQTVKGWFYILTTGALLFWLVKRQLKAINESEERWRFALEGSGDGVWDWNVQTDQVIYSKRWKEMLGHTEDEVGTELKEWSSRVHPEDMPSVMADLQPHLDGQTATYINEHRIRCQDGSYKWILDRGQVITRDAAGKPLRVVGVHTDITNRKLAEEKLKLSATVFSHAREGIMITDATPSIVEVNDTFTEITGYSHEELIGKNPSILKSGRQSPEFYAEMWQTVNTTGYWTGELWNRRKNGEVYAELKTISAVRDENGVIQNYVAMCSDITLMKEHQGQLEHNAHYDLLTNLPNRVLLADRLSQTLVQCSRHEQSLAVAFLDLDAFKEVNDAHGHNLGDELLIALSLRMKEALREGDTLARFGGDEFVAVLTDLDKVEDCEPILERLLLAASEPIAIGELVLNVSASIGVTLYPQDSVDADQLMRHADQAMYVAKQSGKNRYHLFDTTQDNAVKVQREGLEAIRSALDNHQFVLHYQPKVNMRTGTVTGVEALIRWQHPTRGLLSPIEFLPAIENNPMSIEMGEWVMDTALTQISQWQTMGLDLPVSTSINISAVQLQQPDFTDRLTTLLAAHPDVEPRYLELEVLETSALDDVHHVSTIMNDCMALGVNFALDDFGTGYSSLTYLRRLPASLIKIDQSFVRDMLNDADDLAIVEGVIALAKSFKRDVIAEGVETIEHGTALLQLGCELAQGYGIAKPMPAGDVPAWVDKWKPDDAWQA
jgi:diguanylate cyclase (GGDEF)-like protein/PAS domain S-box-containing protein